MKKNQRYGKYLYEKKDGKYIPINDPYACDGLEKGAWLVIARPGSKSIRKILHPSFIELEAALTYLEDGLCKAMSKAGEIRSRTVKISEKERRAWKVFDQIMGDDKPTMYMYPSNYEIAQAGCEYIRKIMTENNMDINKIKENIKPRKRIGNAILGLEGIES